MVRRLLLLAALAWGLTPAAAGASGVSYGSLNTSTCASADGCGVLTQALGGTVTVSFVPVTPTTILADPFAPGSFSGSASCGSMSCSEPMAALNLFVSGQAIPAGRSRISPSSITWNPADDELRGSAMSYGISALAAVEDAVIPEPTALALLSVAFFGLSLWRRRT